MVSLVYEGEKQVIKFMLKKKRALIFWFVSSMVSLFSLSSQNSASAQLRHNPSKDHSQQSGEEQAWQTRAMALCFEIACKPWWIVYRQEENQACWKSIKVGRPLRPVPARFEPRSSGDFLSA